MLTWLKRLMGKGAKRPQQEVVIANPYVGLTDAQIIERRRKIAVLYPTPSPREQLRARERAVQQESDGMGFTTGLFLGAAMGGHGASPVVDERPSYTPSFEAGGGSFGGGGASEGFDSPSDSGSSDSGSCDSGGGGE